MDIRAYKIYLHIIILGVKTGVLSKMKNFVMNFFPGNMKGRNSFSRYIVGHIQCLRLPQKCQISYFSVKYGHFHEKLFIYLKPL